MLEELYANDLDPHLSEIAHHLALAAPVGDVSRRRWTASCGRATGPPTWSPTRRPGPTTSERWAWSAPPKRPRASSAASCCCAWATPTGEPATLAPPGGASRRPRRWPGGSARARCSPARRSGYVVGLGGLLLFARFEAGATGDGLLEEALAALPETDSPLRARVLARLAVEMYPSHEAERRVSSAREAIEMSRRLEDSEALVTALHARHWARGAPEMVYERLQNSRGDARAWPRSWATRSSPSLRTTAASTASWSSATAPGLDAEIAAMVELADRIHQPFYRWHGVCLKVIRAVLDGRFDDAERLGKKALRIARLRHSEYAAYVYEHAQLVAIRWAQGGSASTGRGRLPRRALPVDPALARRFRRRGPRRSRRRGAGARARSRGTPSRTSRGTGSGCCASARSRRPA